ncbi:MAG: hypothetical protein K2M56_07005 [Muribaculaceae bacterium]|nr:hypothetical protein [Muribaculaceae bacterium]
MSIIKKLKLYRIKTVLRYIPESWKNSATLIEFSKRGRLKSFLSLLYWYYFYGFDFIDYISFRFWELSAAERKSYISYRRNDILRFRLSDPESYELFLDKALFNERFRQYVQRDWKLLSESDPIHDLNTFMKNHPEVIVKPVADYGGRGVIKLSASSSDEDKRHIFKDVNVRYIVEECIQNNDNLKKLAPGSLNTIRFVTLIDKTGEPDVLVSALRMGDGTSFMDNFQNGGMACAIDPLTGELRGKAYGMNCTEYESHPFSGIKFDGYKIEGFRRCLDLVKDLCQVVPSARYVGWDIAITPRGIEVIEGNIPPGEYVTQIISQRGLWDDILSRI